VKRRQHDHRLPRPGLRWIANVFSLYRVRLRHRWLQELLAVAGIAAGVALLFASQVASTSLSGPVEELNRGLVGNSQLQLVGRGGDGFSARTVARVAELPGVRIAAPILQVQANVVGPRGAHAVTIFGADPRTVELDGSLLQGFTAQEAAEQETLALPAPIALQTGIRFGDDARLQIGGYTRTIPAAVIGPEELGELAQTSIAVTPLAYLQRLTGRTGRVSRILVEADPGHVDSVRAGLRRIAGNRLDVRPADYEPRLFDIAARPTSQATTISSVVSALVGFLFAFCAMLVTVASRRALAIDLRLDGYRPGQVIRILLFDALALGVVAVAGGLVLGELLSRRGYGSDVSFLGGAFPLGDARIVTWSSVATAAGGGLLAAALGVLAPLRTVIFARVPRREHRADTARRRRGAIVAPAAGVVGLAVAVAITALAPGAALAGLIALGLALVLLLPSVLRGVVAVLAALSARRRRAIVAVELALPQLRAREWHARSLAIATTGAIAVFGAVSLEGARANLQDGLDRVTIEVSHVTDLWVLPPGAGDLFVTTSFTPRAQDTIAGAPGVASVERYRGAHLDVADRRVWVLAPPPDAPHPIPAGQVRDGDPRQATSLLRGGGWAALSRAVAADLGVKVGDRFVLPAPRPVPLRVAAITTNLGWSGGSVVVSSADFARGWGGRQIAAFQVGLDPATSPQRGRDAVTRALGPQSALRVETAAEHSLRQRTSAAGGLSRLQQIATLTLIAAVLAMASAMAALLWQRRPTVARQKLDGYGAAAMWRSLVVESGALFVTGCLAGAAFGVLGQVLFSRALEAISGFPVVVAVRLEVAAVSFALVMIAAMIVVAVPGYLVARVRPSLRTGD
jgi:putative ABC transport system permease protein